MIYFSELSTNFFNKMDMMSHQNNPFRMNVGFLINIPLGESREYPFIFENIYIKPDHDLKNVRGVAIFSKTSAGILVKLILSCTILTECARCLCNFLLPLEIDFTELFAFSKKTFPDSELIFPEDGYIDLNPIISEYIVLAKPINPLCSQTCKGLCPICGDNLNEKTCDHKNDTNDPRMDILKQFLDSIE